MAEKIRPLGVAILSIIVVLMGIGCFVIAAVFGVLSTAGGTLEALIQQYAGMTGLSGLVAAWAAAVAVDFAIFGVVLLVSAYGLWIGKNWARLLAIIVLALLLIGGIMSLPGGIIIILISGFLIFYLTRSHVAEFFK